MLCRRSLCDSVLLASQRRSVLVPVLKAEGRDVAEPANFRPVASGGDLAPGLGGTEKFFRGPRFLNDFFSEKISISRPKFLMTFF